MPVLVLTEVGPFINEGTDDAYYRSCDFCYETVVNDIWDGKQEADWRKFHELHTGESVCEKCLPGGRTVTT